MSVILSTGANSDIKVVMDSVLTVAAVDTINVPGLRKVLGVVAQWNDDVSDAQYMAQATFGGSLADNQIQIKTWANTGGTDPTPVAAAVFSKRVSYIAFGY